MDPKDNEVYIYSHLEPFFCHRWFPCFDQPSLRAPLRLSIISPDTHWQVISNGKKTSSLPLSDHAAQNLLEELDFEEALLIEEG